MSNMQICKIPNSSDIDLKCHFTLPKIGLPKIKTLTPPMARMQIGIIINKLYVEGII